MKLDIPDSYFMPIVMIKEFLPNLPKRGKVATRKSLNSKPQNMKAVLKVLRQERSKLKPDPKKRNPDDQPRYPCYICKTVQTKMTEVELKDHFKKEHEGKRLRKSRLLSYGVSHVCEICPKVFKSGKRLKEHIETHNNRYDCEACNSSFKKTLDYTLHLRMHSADDVFKCIVCDFETNSINEITEHMSGSHDKTFKYRCKSCNEGFNILTWYQEHDNFHTGARPFECDFCGKQFPYSRYLLAHKNTMHNDVASGITNVHECVICKKRYQHRNSLKLHMNSHTGNVSICDICGKQLSSKEKLKFHMRTHTGYKPFSCSYCGKCFTKKPILVEHERVHTGEKPYKCDYCRKAFSQRSSLVIHMRGHTGERPYVCQACNKGFVARSMLNSHLKSCRGPLV